jgi:hypothetical protein
MDGYVGRSPEWVPAMDGGKWFVVWFVTSPSDKVKPVESVYSSSKYDGQKYEIWINNEVFLGTLTAPVTGLQLFHAVCSYASNPQAFQMIDYDRDDLVQISSSVKIHDASIDSIAPSRDPLRLNMHVRFNVLKLKNLRPPIH